MTTKIRALTICQPWAWAVLGPKAFENRDWHTDYQGPLVIHAGKSTKWMAEGLKFLRDQGLVVPRDLTFGAIIGLVDMVDCVRPEQAVDALGKRDPFAFGLWCFKFERPRALATPVPYVGRQGFFSVESFLVAELLDVEAATNRASITETREQRINRAIAAAGPSRVRRASREKFWGPPMGGLEPRG